MIINIILLYIQLHKVVGFEINWEKGVGLWSLN